MRYQPQGLARVNQSSPLSLKLSGAWVPQNGRTQAIEGASKKLSPQGIGFTTGGSADYWLASPTAIASAASTWTILVLLTGASTNNPQGGVAFYAERPNDTQIIKLGMGDGQTNTASLVVRDQQGNLAKHNGVADVRTDSGKPRVIVGVRRSASNHALYVNGKLDAVNTGSSAGGTFGPTNAAIGNDPNDTRSYLAGASLPLVLVWTRALSDAEIASISANPWQVFEAPDDDEFMAPAAGADANVSPQGVSASASVSLASASAGGRATPSGVNAKTGVGAASASAGAGVTAFPAGVGASGAVGSPIGAGGAQAAPSTNVASALVGTAAASAGASASPAGVAVSAAAGIAVLSAGAIATPAGVAAAAQVGAVTATGGSASTAAPAGVSATASAGQSAAKGGASVLVQGVAATAAAGQASASAGVGRSVAVTGVGAAASVGAVVGSGGARCVAAGVGITASVGAVIAAGNIAISGVALPAGVAAYARVGIAIAAGGGSFARAPAGVGYVSHQHFNESRPAAVQRNNR